MRSIFITASDTDAGKTYVTCALVRALRRLGREVLALKPVASGGGRAALNPDVAALLAAQGLRDAEAINRYSFAAPLAPAQAARLEGKRIEPEALVAWCAAKAATRALTLIEGVGGLMVPLAERYLVCDWLAAMPACRVLLVARARLGGINHMLLSLDKLERMGRTPDWIVLNDADGAGEAMLEHHAQALVGRCGPARVVRLPHGAGPDALEDLAARL